MSSSSALSKFITSPALIDFIIEIVESAISKRENGMDAISDIVSAVISELCKTDDETQKPSSSSLTPVAIEPKTKKHTKTTNVDNITSPAPRPITPSVCPAEDAPPLPSTVKKTKKKPSNFVEMTPMEQIKSTVSKCIPSDDDEHSSGGSTAGKSSTNSVSHLITVERAIEIINSEDNNETPNVCMRMINRGKGECKGMVCGKPVSTQDTKRIEHRCTACTKFATKNPLIKEIEKREKAEIAKTSPPSKKKEGSGKPRAFRKSKSAIVTPVSAIIDDDSGSEHSGLPDISGVPVLGSSTYLKTATTSESETDDDDVAGPARTREPPAPMSSESDNDDDDVAGPAAAVTEEIVTEEEGDDKEEGFIKSTGIDGYFTTLKCTDGKRVIVKQITDETYYIVGYVVDENYPFNAKKELLDDLMEIDGTEDDIDVLLENGINKSQYRGNASNGIDTIE